MQLEQSVNFNNPKPVQELLAQKHDLALDEASEISDRIRQLEEELNLNQRKSFPRGDELREREIEQEYKDIMDQLARKKTELAKKWREIDKTQAELLQ